MTAEQRSELDRAIDRATKAGLEVHGVGRRKSDNARVFAVPSQSEENLYHLVALVGSRLVCECKASQYGHHICCHRAAVHMYLTVEAERKQRQAEEVEAALRAEREEEAEMRLHEAARTLDRVQRQLDAHDRRETAMPACRANNRAVSMWR